MCTKARYSASLSGSLNIHFLCGDLDIVNRKDMIRHGKHENRQE